MMVRSLVPEISRQVSQLIRDQTMMGGMVVVTLPLGICRAFASLRKGDDVIRFPLSGV